MRAVALLALVLLPLAGRGSAQTLPAAARAYLGDWTIVDEGTNEAQAVVRISQAGAGVEGRIIRVLPTREFPTPSTTCASCRGQYRNADLRRVLLIRGMTWNRDHFAGGRITDPQHDREYRSTLTLDGPNRLRVRGYVGVRALGRTQVWTRAR